MGKNDYFINFMGYRNMVLEDKIEECLEARLRNKSSIVDVGELTDLEIEYIENEVCKRMGLGSK